MAKPQLFFQNEKGVMFPVHRLKTTDRIVIEVDSKAACDRVRGQIEEHYEELVEQVIVFSNPDPDIVKVNVVKQEADLAAPPPEQMPNDDDPEPAPVEVPRPSPGPPVSTLRERVAQVNSGTTRPTPPAPPGR